MGLFSSFLGSIYNAGASAISYATPYVLSAGSKTHDFLESALIGISSVVKKATKVTRTVFSPTEALNTYLKNTLSSFSFKELMEAPSSPLLVKVELLFIKTFLHKLKIPFLGTIFPKIEEKIKAPSSKLDKKDHDRVVEVVSQVATQENIEKTAGIILNSLTEISHALKETEAKLNGATDPRVAQNKLLQKLGIHKSLESFKKDAKAKVEVNIRALVEKSRVLIKTDSFLKRISFAFVALITRSISVTLIESAAETVIKLLSEKQELVLENSLMRVELSKKDLKLIKDKIDVYKEIVLWFLMQKVTEQLCSGSPAENIDTAWSGLIEELQPVISKTVSSASQRASAPLGRKLVTLSSFCLGLTNEEIPAQFLTRFAPSKVIPTLVEGIQQAVKQ